MSLLESNESVIQFTKFVQQGIGSFEKFAGVKARYRSWKNNVDESIEAVGMGVLLSSACLPVYDVANTAAGVSAFTLVVEKYKMAHRHIRLRLKEALSEDLKREVDQLPLTKVTDFLSNVTMPEDADLRKTILDKVTDHADEKKERYADKFPSVFVILSYLSKRFVAVTPLEKNELYTAFHSMKMGDESIEHFVARVKEARAVLIEVGEPIGDLAVQNVIVQNLPRELQWLASRLMAQKLPLQEVIDSLTEAWKNEKCMSKTQSLTQSTQSKRAERKTGAGDDQALEALPVFSSSSLSQSAQNFSGRGRGGFRGGRGGHQQSDTRAGRNENRDVRLVCHCCGGVGHKKAQCPSNPTVCLSSTQPAVHTQSRSDIVCDYCKQSGHTAAKCWKRKKDAQQDKKKSAMLANGKPVTALSVTVFAHSDGKSVDLSEKMLDSGAEMSISNNIDEFVEYEALEKPLEIIGIDPTHPVLAEGIGTIALVLEVEGKPQNTTFSDVLFVRTCPCTLLSVGWLGEKQNIAMETTLGDENTPAQWFGRRNGKIVFEAEMKRGGNRYYLKRWTGAAVSANMSNTQIKNSNPTHMVSTCANLNSVSVKSIGVNENKSIVTQTHSESITHTEQTRADGEIADEPAGVWECSDPTVSPMMLDENLLKKIDVARAELAACVGSVQKELVFYDDYDEHLNGAKQSVAVLASSVNERAKQIEEARLWHEKLGHIGARRLLATLTRAGVKPGFTEREAAHAVHVCEACSAARGFRVPHPKFSAHRSTVPGEVWHFDAFGPARTRSIGGAYYYGVLVDECSLYTHTLFASNKSKLAESVVERLKQMRVRGVKIAVFVSDNAREFACIWKYCRENGIAIHLTVPGESEQNGLAERMIGLMTEKWRALRNAARAPKEMWGEGVSYARFLHNHTSHISLGWRSPAEMLFDEFINLSKLYPFGCAVWMRLEGVDKLGDRAVECCFVGVDDVSGRKGWRVWWEDKHKLFACWNCKFVECVFPWHRKARTGVVDDGDELSVSAPDSASAPAPQPPASAPAPPPTAAAAPVPVTPPLWYLNCWHVTYHQWYRYHWYHHVTTMIVRAHQQQQHKHHPVTPLVQHLVIARMEVMVFVAWLTSRTMRSSQWRSTYLLWRLSRPVVTSLVGITCARHVAHHQQGWVNSIHTWLAWMIRS